MSLKDQINDDMKTAMRAKETERLGTIRLLLAAIKQREVDDRVTLDDAGITAVIDKMIKQRKDSISQFEAAGRTDLADKEKAKLAVLSAYMPRTAFRRCDRRRGSGRRRRDGRCGPAGHGQGDGCAEAEAGRQGGHDRRVGAGEGRARHVRSPINPAAD